jgi:hypothetical protein
LPAEEPTHAKRERDDSSIVRSPRPSWPPARVAQPRKTGSAGAPASPIEHVAIIVKENHTFDNYFGTFPGAVGATEPHAADPEASDPPHDHHAWLHRDHPGPGGAHRLRYLKADNVVPLSISTQPSL